MNKNQSPDLLSNQIKVRLKEKGGKSNHTN
jgi:hypothetical protein